MSISTRIAAFVVSLLCALAAEAKAGLLLNDTNVETRRIQNPDNGETAYIVVTGPDDVQINQIGVVTGLFWKVTPGFPGNMEPMDWNWLKFMIAETNPLANVSQVLYLSEFKAFTDRTMQLRLSDVFAPITLKAGKTYSIGYMAFNGGEVGIRSGSAFTQNGLTNQPVGATFANYISPRFVFNNAASQSIQIYGIAVTSSPPGSAVPEPSTVASLGLAGLIGLAARFRRRLLASA
jgi:hypothetical protein